MKPLTACRVAIVVGGVLALASATGHGAEKGWGYAGANGPVKWGTLDKAFEDCKDGELQAPIDLSDATAQLGALPSLLFDYRATPLKIIDNGHTIQVNIAPGNFLMVSGKKYELLSLQFHKPSEEKVNGKGHDMSVHLVHKGMDNKPAIVAVMLDAGAENKLVKTLWDNLPKDKNKEMAIEGATINPLDLLPKSKGYFTFSGSLTAPPCTENVTWFVLKTPVTVSADQIARFGRLYPMNARPLQPSHNRYVQGTH